MPTTTAPKRKKRKISVLKRIRQAERRTALNRRSKSRLRRSIKEFRRALAAGNRDALQKLLGDTLSIIDRSVGKGIIHKNTASRYKARLMARYHDVLSASASA